MLDMISRGPKVLCLRSRKLGRDRHRSVASNDISDGHIPWVTSGAVNASVVQSADEFITDAAIRETNCKVFPAGTILMAMYGEGQTRGRVAVLGINAATNQALAAIQVRTDGPAVRDFVLWHLRSGYLDLRHRAAGGVQPNLNLGIIKAWRIYPCRHAKRQREIVRRIKSHSLD